MREKIINFIEYNLEEFDEEQLKIYEQYKDGKFTDEDMLDKFKLVECSHCGEIMFANDSYMTADDYVLCQYCFDNETQYCDRCQQVYYDTEMHETDRDNWVCDSCADEMTVCDHCGILIENNYYYAEDTGRYFCEDCRDNGYVEYCNDCGNFFEHTHYSENSGNTYCDECWQERGENVVENYSYKINPLFLKSERENELGRKVLEYLGVEVEMEKGEFDVLEEVKNDLDKLAPNYNEMICWKHDGSLDDGAEMNSVACSMNKWTELKDDFGKAFQKLIDAGWRSHDTNHCGYHIHISRNSLGKTKEEQDATIDRMILLTEVFKEEIKKFSRRKDYYYCRFASESGSSYAVAEMDTLAKCKHFKDNDDERYLVINNRNHNTVEFRVFRGTLNINTFMACLQLVHNIANICKKRTLEKFDGIKWLDIINYTKDFKEIKEYNNRRGIKSIKKVDLFQKQQELGLEGEM